MNRFRTLVAEPIFADVVDELTRIGAFVEDVKTADGTCTITARSEDGKVSEFERWLAVFTKGASRVEILEE